MTVAPILTTERLTLRPHRLADFDDYAALWFSEDSVHMDGPLPNRGAWLMFCNDIAQWSLHGFGCWAVERTADKAHVGQVGLQHPPHFPEVELGWMTYAPHRGAGYATEAARCVLDWAFGPRGLRTVVSYVGPANMASRSVANALGAELDAMAERPEEDDLVFRHLRTEAAA